MGGVLRCPAQGALGVPELGGILGCHGGGGGAGTSPSTLQAFLWPGEGLWGRMGGGLGRVRITPTPTPTPLQLAAVSGHKEAAGEGVGVLAAVGGLLWLRGTCMCR